MLSVIVKEDTTILEGFCTVKLVKGAIWKVDTESNIYKDGVRKFPVFKGEEISMLLSEDEVYNYFNAI